MRSSSFVKQRGAVLAFNLVMLMVLTLVSIGMIQQNRTQMSLMSNSALQSSAMTSAERYLVTAANVVTQQRYANQALHKCKSTNFLHENDVLNLGTTAATSKVTKVFCLMNYVAGVGGDENQCKYASGSRVLVAGGTVTAENADACRRLNNAGTTVANTSANMCNSEIYSVSVTYTSASTTQAKRTLETKIALDCSGDIL